MFFSLGVITKRLLTEIKPVLHVQYSLMIDAYVLGNLKIKIRAECTLVNLLTAQSRRGWTPRARYHGANYRNLIG